MSRLVVRPAQATRWPIEEISPYVDWWRHVDRAAGPQDPKCVRELALSTKPALARRSLDATLSRTGDGDIWRRVPMWDWSLPPNTGNGSSEAKIPQPAAPRFGDAMTPPDNKPTAVLVVIDTDINPLHERFRDDKNRPRILAHWMMEGRYDDRSPRVPFGREVRTDDLVAAQQGRTEEEALQSLGSHSLTEPFAPRGTAQLAAHGTHVLDLAGGAYRWEAGPEFRAMRRVPILAVSLPSNRLLSPSGTFLRVFVEQALAWAETRLTELLGSDAWPRVVVNLSYGLSAGPKDGTGYLPERIRAFLGRHPSVRMFMPAGNDGDSDLHTVLFAEDGQREVGWLVMPADPYSAFAEVWTTGDPSGIGLRLRTPDGDELEVPDLAGMDLSTPLELADPGPPDLPVARIYPLGSGAVDDRLGILLCVAPTRRDLPGTALAPGGIWSIKLLGSGSMRADVHLQSERPLLPRSLVGRPSRLVKTEGPAPGPEGTLNAVAVGACTIVQAIRASDRSCLAWTSKGDQTYLPPFAPSLEVEGEESAARRWLRAAGARSGSTALVEGTSFACAKAARKALQDVFTPSSI